MSDCSPPIENIYKQEEIAQYVENICKLEYNLKVITKSSANTLWIYTPLPRIIHQDFSIDKEKFLDEEVVDKLRNILTTVGRVFLSAENPPEFYCLVASDINIGIDYTLIGNTLDIIKSYAGAIPWTETNRRYVIKVELNPEAILDETGKHLKPYDIKLEDFLAQQIVQRIGIRFQEEDLKKQFQIEKVNGKFMDGIFVFEYAIKKLNDSKIKVEDEMLALVSYVLNSYEFENFSQVEIRDLFSGNRIIFTKGLIKSL